MKRNRTLATLTILGFVLGFLVGRFSKPTLPVQGEQAVNYTTVLSQDDLDRVDPYGDQEEVVPKGGFMEIPLSEAHAHAVLPASGWVMVQIEDAPNGNHVHKVGERCAVLEGGTIKSTNFGIRDKILVGYSYPKRVSDSVDPSGLGGGTQCGGGTFFLLSKPIFTLLRNATIFR